MSAAQPNHVTIVLGRMSRGDVAAANELLPMVYDELRRLAQSHLSHQQHGHTLQATALVHEAYLKLAGSPTAAWQDRTHFLAVAATAMRQILSNHARDKRAEKRGGARVRVTLADGQVEENAPEFDPVELDDVLAKLASMDAVQGRIVELRFFSGMSVEEIGHVMEISPRTVKRQWRVARAWLNAELNR